MIVNCPVANCPPLSSTLTVNVNLPVGQPVALVLDHERAAGSTLRLKVTVAVFPAPSLARTVNVVV